MLLPFATTYLCKIGLSYYTATKTKYGSGLNVISAPDTINHLSSINPNIKKIVLRRGAQLTLTKHYIVGTKLGDSGPHVGSQII